MSIENQPIYLVLENIRSLFNVGSMFRCADVFAVSKIFLCGYTGTPPRSQISKTALGADEWISWEHKTQTAQLLKNLKKQGFAIVALEAGQGGKLLPDFKAQFPLVLVVGNEIDGVSKKVLALADETLEIPMLGQKESLNVAIACGIALYQLRN
ncbi:MAG: RNA methyltransferase [Patescibacteria group bacterium]|jgi:tRNA G18 (ribose-2'-O)-methylase SpoU|nr:RNA methyltransferase [Patescibacteria group bacterium]